MITLQTLDRVLQYDTETKENTNTCFLTVDDRWAINRIRSLMIGQIIFDAHTIPVADVVAGGASEILLYNKIHQIIKRIIHQGWKPTQIIEYKF